MQIPMIKSEVLFRLFHILNNSGVIYFFKYRFSWLLHSKQATKEPDFLFFGQSQKSPCCATPFLLHSTYRSYHQRHNFAEVFFLFQMWRVIVKSNFGRIQKIKKGKQKNYPKLKFWLIFRFSKQKHNRHAAFLQ